MKTVGESVAKVLARIMSLSDRKIFLLAAGLAVLVVIAVHFLNFPGSVPRFKEVSGGGVLLDQTPSFSVDETYRRLGEYGDEGRRSYAFRNVTVDIALPLALLPFLFLLMLKAVGPLTVNRSVRLALLSLPFVYVAFDFAENGAVLILLNNYPVRSESLAGTVPYITSIKRVASLLAIFIPLGIIGIRVLRARLKKGETI